MLYEGGLIESKELIAIIKDFHKIISIFKLLHFIENEPNIVNVSDPVIIVGDIHGQFFDLIKILALFS